MEYSVLEIFRSFQGEGTHAGLPVVFLRLAGCSVGCPFCDTKESWSAAPMYPVSEIVDSVSLVAAGARVVVITGGEPGEQPLAALVEALHDAGYKIHAETSGTAPGVLGAGIDWITVSPKQDMPGGRKIIDDVIAAADELKFVIGRMRDVNRMWKALDAWRGLLKKSCIVSVQPMSLSKTATAICRDVVLASDIRMSIQTHKIVGVA